MKPLIAETLNIAKTQVGVREVNLSNSGPQVDQYIRRAGLRPPAYWCACFAYWCVDEAAKKLNTDNPLLRSASCHVIAAWAQEHECLYPQPAPGDSFLLYHRTGAGFVPHHTGLVVSVEGGQVQTVEGNTNRGGSPNGDGVYVRHRGIGPSLRFVRWADLSDEPDKPNTWPLFLNGREVGSLVKQNGRLYCPVRKWAEAFGFRLGWDDVDQTFSFNGKVVPSPVHIVNGVAYAPVRDLAAAAKLRLRLDDKTGNVVVSR